jgi:hypothetical protein
MHGGPIFKDHYIVGLWLEDDLGYSGSFLWRLTKFDIILELFDITQCISSKQLFS